MPWRMYASGPRVAGKDEAEGDGGMVDVLEQQAAIQRMRRSGPLARRYAPTNNPNQDLECGQESSLCLWFDRYDLSLCDC